MSSIQIPQKLGFGLMRLPTLEDGSINMPLFCELVDRFLGGGFTYFDTAYVYHDGKSERAVKKALIERHQRDRYTIATKMPHNFLTCREDVDKTFEEQLERTGAGYFDYYLMHGINNKNWERYENFGCWEHARRMRDKRLVRHLGFSFHGTPDLLERLLDSHPETEFVQLQINYADWDNPRICSGKCYDIVSKRGLPVFVMEPVKGGMLARLPQKANDILKQYAPEASAPSWAFRFVAELESVKVILSGMNTVEQLEDNMRTLADPKPLSAEEKAVLDEARNAILSVPIEPCTGCRYCVNGCPAGLEIPNLIQALNNCRLFKGTEGIKAYWKNQTKDGTLPAKCLGCGQCEGACPQHLTIISILCELKDFQ